MYCCWLVLILFIGDQSDSNNILIDHVHKPDIVRLWAASSNICAVDLGKLLDISTQLEKAAVDYRVFRDLVANIGYHVKCSPVPVVRISLNLVCRKRIWVCSRSLESLGGIYEMREILVMPRFAAAVSYLCFLFAYHNAQVSLQYEALPLVDQYILSAYNDMILSKYLRSHFLWRVANIEQVYTKIMRLGIFLWRFQ